MQTRRARWLAMSRRPNTPDGCSIVPVPRPFSFAALHGDVVEHLMRVTDDEATVFAAHQTRSPTQLRSVIGRALGTMTIPMPPGSPILALSGLSEPDPQWRAHVDVADPSLWAELEFHLACGYTERSRCAWLDLERARRVAADMLSGGDGHCNVGPTLQVEDDR